MSTKATLLMWLILNACTLQAQDNHNYLVSKYQSLHDSEVQHKFRKIHPMPAGVVYIQHPGEGEKEMREHFRLMKELGFNSLKQIMPSSGWSIPDIQEIALEEGIIPWYYGEAGWASITDDLLNELGIPLKSDLNTIRNHPKMLAYQQKVMKERIERSRKYLQENGHLPIDSKTAYNPIVGRRGLDLTDEGKKLFVEWAKNHYQDIEKLNHAWNFDHVGMGRSFESWEDFDKNWESNPSHRNYKNIGDILTFKARYASENVKGFCEELKSFDPEIPFRSGGEMGLFLPHAYMSTNMEWVADAIKDYGSFYPSTHLSWHFNETNNEVVRPFYMQASIMNDLNKGGWTGGWESSGGPQQFDGEKYASELNSYYVDGGTLMQMYMSQMAAGFKGFGIWCWSIRTAGKEGGEYALLDRNNQPTDRAIRLGMMGKAMQKYRDEIWEAYKEPVVGVLLDWNNDAVWAAMSVRGRESFRSIPIEARIGASRALINANVPYEFVTPDDLKNGLTHRYPVIYLPSMIALDQEAFDILEQYVQEGGRLVMDMPGGKFDHNTAIMPTGKGTRFERIFGASLDNYQFSGSNVTIKLQNQSWTGLIADFTPTTGKVKDYYNSGKPAIIENKYGKGSAVVIGLDLAHQCFKAGHKLAEQLFVQQTLGNLESPYQCNNAIVYRLSNLKADHYYFINDGEAQTVTFSSKISYKNAVDALTGETVNPDAIDLGAHDARWIRMEK